MTTEHQWNLRPQAIHLREATGGTCDDPSCPSRIQYHVAIPTQPPALNLCEAHTMQLVASATGKRCRKRELKAMLGNPGIPASRRKREIIHLPMPPDLDMETQPQDIWVDTLCHNSWHISKVQSLPTMPTCKECRKRMTARYPREAYHHESNQSTPTLVQPSG